MLADGCGSVKDIRSTTLTGTPLTTNGVVSTGAGGRDEGATVFNRGIAGKGAASLGSCLSIGNPSEGGCITGGPIVWLLLLTGAVEGLNINPVDGDTPGALVVAILRSI